MSTTTEVNYSGEFLISQSEGDLSKDQITIATGQTVLAGSILGQKVLGTATASAVTGTGNGVISAVTTKSNGKVGIYTFTCVLAATNGGTFSVIDPDGNQLPHLYVGVAYSNHLALTVADGATDFTVGAFFTVTVVAGSGEHVPVNLAGVDGSSIAVAVARDAMVTAAATKTTAYTRSCEVARDGLDFGALSAPQIVTATAQLALKSIIVRSTVG